MSNLNASQIAAQAAMQARVDANNPSHMRKRSMTLPDPNDKTGKGGVRKQSAPSPPPPVPTFNISMSNRSHLGDGFSGGHKLAAATAATTAANAAFPRSPQFSPLNAEHGHGGGSGGLPDVSQVKHGKEKSKMKLFSKPKSIGIIKDKDVDKKYALPSPNKLGMSSTVTLPRFGNASTTSLVDPSMSSASSIYSSANASTSTLVPSVSFETKEKEKEKHGKHNFLSRQKHKLKDKDHENYNLPLSSSSSTSRPTDPNAPQPLYSFAAPASPGHSSSFAKSVSGLDLRHGGRALREKKKEEKAAAQNLLAPIASSSVSVLSDAHSFRERDPSFSGDRPEWPGPGSLGALASSSLGATSPVPSGMNATDYTISQPAVSHLASAFSLPGMGPDDAWPLLKARLLYIFEGEEPRQPVEDFNSLVDVWIRRCVQLGKPTNVIEDLNELLFTGFTSLDQTLRHVPDERLVPCLVDLWHQVFSTILPFLQGVFLPLDLEFKGRGTIMSAQEASDKWGAKLPPALAMETRSYSQDRPGTADPTRESSPDNPNIPTMGEDLDVRRMTLLTYRDTVILPRIEKLMGIFSRLSLENLSAGFAVDTNPLPEPPSLAALAGAAGREGTNSRPSTAPSIDPSTGSYSSGTILDGSLGSMSGFGARSRATSNTSAGSFQSIPGVLAPPSTSNPAVNASLHGSQPMDSAKVTEIVGRMLQCVSVLAGVQTGDEAQEAMERLAREMKLNWLGRGRTGRQRRGFVGTKMPRHGAGMGAVGEARGTVEVK
ncbi:HbrB-like protein [Rhizodiscina lignyota]|uniref:HbrB-like protein n=1 Tax=Rhizodiscina lignyota TaxID=1504668 RepID=A0A9P4M3D5_9PEZI|nr:HbrB-like protein [Rhizodiscina lignyota]